MKNTYYDTNAPTVIALVFLVAMLIATVSVVVNAWSSMAAGACS